MTQFGHIRMASNLVHSIHRRNAHKSHRRNSVCTDISRSRIHSESRPFLSNYIHMGDSLESRNDRMSTIDSLVLGIPVGIHIFRFLLRNYQLNRKCHSHMLTTTKNVMICLQYQFNSRGAYVCTRRFHSSAFHMVDRISVCIDYS